jgi:hypothetical protein
MTRRILHIQVSIKVTHHIISNSSLYYSLSIQIYYIQTHVSNYYINIHNTSQHCVRLHYTLLHTLLCASTTQSLQMCALFTHHFRKSADAKLLHSSIPDHGICRFHLQRTNKYSTNSLFQRRARCAALVSPMDPSSCIVLIFDRQTSMYWIASVVKGRARHVFHL